MTLAQFVSTWKDKYIGTGQCGELVDLYLVDCFSNHTAYATALDYWINGIPGFTKYTGVPPYYDRMQPGDIVCYNAHPGYPDGHIAVYNGNDQVFEQNADPDSSPAHLYNRATTYLLGYLRQGEETVLANQANVENLIGVVFNRPWTQADVDFWMPAIVNNNLTYQGLVEAMQNSQEYLIDVYVNEGDVLNMAAKGIDISAGLNQFWKPAMYLATTKGTVNPTQPTTLEPGLYEVS